MNLRLILGSKSAGRRSVLNDAGYEFSVVTADIDEKSIRENTPKKLVLALAHAKADALIKKIFEPAIIITADQVVLCDGEIREKPKSADEARAFIRAYSTFPMETVSSLVVTNTQTGQRAEGVDIAKVFFSHIPETAIEQGIHDGRIMHCAGAMRCEDAPFNAFVVKIEGTYDSTSGMPLKLLRELVIKVQEDPKK